MSGLLFRAVQSCLLHPPPLVDFKRGAKPRFFLPKIRLSSIFGRMKTPQIIDHAFLDSISAQAKDAPRKRKNFNFHATETDLSHRLLNALEPNTYIAPHRHLDPNKDESMVIVRGKMGAVFFDEIGRVTQTALLIAGGAVVALNIPAGTFHSLVALAPDTVFFEAKAGPYAPLTVDERAAWAPQEGEAGVADYLARLTAHFI